MDRPRAKVIDAFLGNAGWAAATRTMLAGDASARQYHRLHLSGRSAILMNADPARGEGVERFLQVGAWLLSKGYSAPRVYASDTQHGLLLLEDFGDDLVARLVETDPARELPLYLATTDFLFDLGRHAPPKFLRLADGAVLADLSARIGDWYLPAANFPSNTDAQRIPTLIASLFDELSGGLTVVSLRDFHAENLIWLPARPGVERAGLLDFQDAFVTHPAYDLVSLLQDARRDISGTVEAACIAAYIAKSQADEQGFRAVYSLLGAQRALRLIAIFSRLCLRDGKAKYLDYIPRVWSNLRRNLTHPALAALESAVMGGIPEPTPEILDRIKEKCGKHPML